MTSKQKSGATYRWATGESSNWTTFSWYRGTLRLQISKPRSNQSSPINPTLRKQAAHQGPAGLVAVFGGRLENGDLQRRPGPPQLGGRRDAGRTAAANQDLVMGHGWGETRQLKRLFQI